jgi:hypothetical protein
MGGTGKGQKHFFLLALLPFFFLVLCVSCFPPLGFREESALSSSS